jgi:putative hydrolase of the HAD superfamily
MKKYKHIYFDLDHTIWDFDKNAEETLLELYDSYQLANLGLPKDAFLARFLLNCSTFYRKY